MFTRLRHFFQIRIVRYALVGGIGIPIHDGALFLFQHFVSNNLYPLALACAFEVSTIINFVLNQLYTYHEQKQLRGWDWIKRALKAQATSLSALAISYLITLALYYGLHLNPYVASPIGIICTFFYNFIISRRFVFRPAPVQSITTGDTPK